MTDPQVSFSIATFERGDESIPVAVTEHGVFDLRAAFPGLIRTTDLFAQWDANLDRIAAFLADEQGNESVARLDPTVMRPLPPVQPVGAVIAAGANYREHVLQLSVAHKLGRSDASDAELRDEAAAEIDERARVGHPYVWAGLSSAVSGANDDIRLPEVGENVDWELELGVIISRSGFAISIDDAPSYIAGYTICNDLSIRSLIPRRDVPMMGTDWFRSKNAPGFYPTGPYLTPARFVNSVSDLRIQLWVNGEIKQDETANDLIFNVPQLISYVSAHVPLQAGDMLITGSPAGNGSHFGRFLQAGDVVEASITGLGSQRNAVIGRTGQLPPWYAQTERDPLTNS